MHLQLHSQQLYMAHLGMEIYLDLLVASVKSSVDPIYSALWVSGPHTATLTFPNRVRGSFSKLLCDILQFFCIGMLMLALFLTHWVRECSEPKIGAVWHC